MHASLEEEQDYFSLHRALEDTLDSDSQLDLIQSKIQGIRIGEKLTDEHIRIIKEKFLGVPDQTFSKLEFQNVLEDVNSNIVFPNDEEYNILFKKMDYKRDERIDWDEFVTYLLLEFQEKDATSGTSTKTLLEPPISSSIKILKSGHRHPIVRITYCPTVDNDRQMNYHNGKYMTASKDGVIHYWSLDMVLERTVISSCPELKVNSTWVTDMICMPDISIVCTSSTERDLRFYDTTAKKFELRVMISSLENAVCCMDYYFSSNIAEESKLILGDMGGSVHIMLFNSESRGPFRQKPGIDVVHLRYEAVVRGQLTGLKVVSFLTVHHDWVSQVSYYETLKSFVSCCPTQEASMLICDIGQTRKPYIFNIPNKGITCFAIDEDIHMIVTGGADCLVRVWNPFVPVKASSTFKGHHAAICAIVIQKETHMLYSISKDRCIKVWHFGTQTCIQTFTGLSSAVGIHQNTPITIYYNPERHTMMVASLKIALVICEKVVNEIYTDGFTHTKAVIKAMYNPLFKCLVTIGMDSCIMVWDPFLGRRVFLVKRAHTQMLYGDVQEVEITAGTFDPTYTLLITGARDGTLKIWNFNTGTCVRNMSIEKNCRVTNVIWIPNRILAVGWNRHVTEFADSGNVGDGKHWETRHTEDILASCIRPPQALVTSSYNGELIFWRLETGQPYKKFFVGDPDKKHTIVFSKEKEKDDDIRISNFSSAARLSIQGRLSSYGVKSGGGGSSKIFSPRETSPHSGTRLSFSNSSMISDRGQSATSIRMFEGSVSTSEYQEEIPVHATLFLNERPMDPKWGTLLVSLESGIIQLWSHHKMGGIVASFDSHSGPEDFVITMATNADNTYLFTGDTSGYIKIWLVTNFGVPEEHRVDIDSNVLKKNFCYFAQQLQLNNRIVNVPPILLLAYQGHTMTVTHIEYLSTMQLLISCSVDRTVRFWNLRGHYLGTLGSLQRWIRLVPDQPVPELSEFRVPPDIRRIGSDETLKVLENNYYEGSKSLEAIHQTELKKELSSHRELLHSIHGSPASKPILGKFFELPHRGIRRLEKPKVDVSVGPSIQVYAHMRTHPVAEVKDNALPSALLAKVKPKTQKAAVTTGSLGSIRTSIRSLRSALSLRTGSSMLFSPIPNTKEKGSGAPLPNIKEKGPGAPKLPTKPPAKEKASPSKKPKNKNSKKRQ